MCMGVASAHDFRPHHIGLSTLRSDFVQDTVEDVVFCALTRQCSRKRYEWSLAEGIRARVFALNLFRDTDAPVSIAMAVLAYLERIRCRIVVACEDLACELLLLGLFIVGFKVREAVLSAARAYPLIVHTQGSFYHQTLGVGQRSL